MPVIILKARTLAVVYSSMFLEDGLILFFALTPILVYALIRSAALQGQSSQQKRLILQSTMLILVVLLVVQLSSHSSWNTVLDLFLEVFLRFLVISVVIAFLALSYVMLKARRKTLFSSETSNMPDDQPTRVKSIAFHPNNDGHDDDDYHKLSWMIIALYSGHVVICKGNKSFRYAVSPGFAIRACIFAGGNNNSNNTWIAASDDHMIRVFSSHDHDNGRLLFEFQGHDDYIRSLATMSAADDDRSLLLSASDDTTVKLWDMSSNYTCLKTFHGHFHYVMQVCSHPRQKIFATASLDRTIKIWSIDRPDSLSTLDGHCDGVNAIDFCGHDDDDDDYSNGKNNHPFLVSASDDRTVRLWNYETRQQLHVLRGHLHNVTAVRFVSWNGDSSVGIVSTSIDCTVRFWRCSTNTTTTSRDYGEGEEAVKTIQYAPLGRGWALATRRSANNLEDQVLAIGLDQACMLLDVQCNETDGTVIVSKETNMSQHILETRHVPFVVHSHNIV